MSFKVDLAEVADWAVHLEFAHGLEGALSQAARLAALALSDGEFKEHLFWRSVEAGLTMLWISN